jgi:hypothetical protein
MGIATSHTLTCNAVSPPKLLVRSHSFEEKLTAKESFDTQSQQFTEHSHETITGWRIVRKVALLDYDIIACVFLVVDATNPTLWEFAMRWLWCALAMITPRRFALVAVNQSDVELDPGFNRASSNGRGNAVPVVHERRRQRTPFSVNGFWRSWASPLKGAVRGSS